MTLAEGLYVELARTPAILQFVEERIYRVTSPELDLSETIQPTLVFWQMARSQEADLALSAVIDRSQWGIWCLAADYDEVKGLEDAVIASLNFFRDDLGGVMVQSISLISSEDTEDQLQFGVFGVLCGFEIVRSTL